MRSAMQNRTERTEVTKQSTSRETLTGSELAELRRLAAAYEMWRTEHPGALQYSNERHHFSSALLAAAPKLFISAEEVLVAAEAAEHYDFEAGTAIDGIIHCLGHERRDLRAERDQLAELAERRRLALIVRPYTSPDWRKCSVCLCVWETGSEEQHDADCLARPLAAFERMFAK